MRREQRTKGKKKEIVFSRKMQEKLAITFIIVIVALFALNIRLLYINSTKGEDYTVQVLDQQNISNLIVPFQRGDILDRNGVVLAKSIKVYNLIIDPKVILSKSDYLEPTVEALVECFGYDAGELRKIINDNSTRSYYVYAKKLSYEEIKGFLEIKENTKDNPYVRGIWFEDEYERKYPYSSLACHVIGFTSSGNVGTWGIEEYYNSYLNGTDGREYGYVNSDNIMEKIKKEATDGNTVVSTIDLKLQTMIEKYIAEWKEEYNPENIGVMLMNPQNGEIYAMASDVSYDLNKPRDLTSYYTSEEISAMSDEESLNALNKIWRNYCISDTFEPGSTFKPITIAAALEEGKISASQTFDCDGAETIQGKLIGCHNRSGHGNISISQSIAYSCNDALMQIGFAQGVDIFTSYQSRFGFGQKTGIDLSGEASCEGLLYTADKMMNIDLATNSFGQNFNTTMIQMAAAFSSIINGGNYYEPHIVKEILNSKGGIVEEVGTKVIKQTVTKSTSDLIKQGLKECVESGTGTKAAVEGYIISGKTGTAQKLPREDKKYLISFIGFAGYENPELVCYVIVDAPEGENQASSISSVLFSKIMEEALPYLNIFPEDPDGTDQTIPDNVTGNENPENGEVPIQYIP